MLKYYFNECHYIAVSIYAMKLVKMSSKTKILKNTRYMYKQIHQLTLHVLIITILIFLVILYIYI